MRISPNFERGEFSCRCGCKFDTVDVETLAVLEDIRAHFRQPIIINSGCRCPTYNAKIGGAADSQHTKGRAVDIRVIKIDPSKVYEYLNSKFPNKYGIGKYPNFTHIDTRSNGPARW